MDCFIEPLSSPGDLDDIVRIEALTFTKPWTREMYLAELEHRDVSRFYIARDAVGEAVGFCSCWQIIDEIHINNLAVLPEHRRAGTQRVHRLAHLARNSELCQGVSQIARAQFDVLLEGGIRLA